MAILSEIFLEQGATFASFEFEMQVNAEEYSLARLTWNGQTVNCTASPGKYGKRLDEGGWKPTRFIKIQVSLANFSDPTDYPQPNDDFTLRQSEDGAETQYRVFEIANSGDVTLSITGVDTNHPAV